MPSRPDSKLSQGEEVRLQAFLAHSGVSSRRAAEELIAAGQVFVNGKSVTYYYERVVKGFAMPLRLIINGKEVQITPSEEKQTLEFPEEIKTIEVDRNFYVEVVGSEQ